VSTRLDDVSVEERLRDATRAYTDVIEPAPDAWARLRTNIDAPRVLPLPWRRGVVVIAAAIAVAVAIAVLVGVVTLPGVDRHRIQTPLRPVPTPPVSTVAPLVQGPDPASTILTSWRQFHVGFVLIYGDGRVISHADDPGGIIERRLSRRGLALVRAGKLDAGYFLGHSILRPPFPRKKLWAERTPRIWEPSKYALCPYQPMGGGGVALNATDVVDELPAPVQAALDGKQHIYDPSIGTAHWEFPKTKGMMDCWELTAAELQGWDGSFAYGRVTLNPAEIYPHGQPVLWGA
jgi:hypothetical protein